MACSYSWFSKLSGALEAKINNIPCLKREQMARAQHKYLQAVPSLKVGGDSLRLTNLFQEMIWQWTWDLHLPSTPGSVQDNPKQEDSCFAHERERTERTFCIQVRVVSVSWNGANAWNKVLLRGELGSEEPKGGNKGIYPTITAAGTATMWHRLREKTRDNTSQRSVLKTQEASGESASGMDICFSVLTDSLRLHLHTTQIIWVIWQFSRPLRAHIGHPDVPLAAGSQGWTRAQSITIY